MAAVPYQGIREILTQIIRAGGRVSLVSGRLASEVAQLLAIDPLPEIWGCHGWERLRTNGTLERLPLSPIQEEGLVRATERLTRKGWQARLETKHGSLALHWRGASEQEHYRLHSDGVEVMRAVSGVDLTFREFDGGLELRAVGRDKGSAVRSILADAPTGSVCAYLGDDQTDEDAFTEVKKDSGLALLIRTEVRPSQADGWITPPDELLEFLQRWKSLF